MERFKNRRRDAQLAGGKEHALHVPQKVYGAGDLHAVQTEFPLVFIDVRFEDDPAVAALRFGGEAGALRSLADELLVVADAQRRARAKVKYGFGAIGFALRVSAHEHIDPVAEDKGLFLVVSEVLQLQFFDYHRIYPKNTFFLRGFIL